MTADQKKHIAEAKKRGWKIIIEKPASLCRASAERGPLVFDGPLDMVLAMIGSRPDSSKLK